MSNYRAFYGQPGWSEDFTPKQWRRGARKSERDLLAGGEPSRHPNYGRGVSGNPALRRSGHFQVAGWTGDRPGDCGVECSCGTKFDGFDTIGEASVLLQQHIARSRPARPRPALKGSFYRYVAYRMPGVRRLQLAERAR